jgi:hypothetical protein
MKFLVSLFLFSLFMWAALAARNMEDYDIEIDQEHDVIYFVEKQTSWLKSQNLLNLIQAVITQIGDLLADEILEKLVFSSTTEEVLPYLLDLVKLFPKKQNSNDQSNLNTSQLCSYNQTVALLRDHIKEVQLNIFIVYR